MPLEKNEHTNEKHVRVLKMCVYVQASKSKSGMIMLTA